jgi:hypothetical protein
MRYEITDAVDDLRGQRPLAEMVGCGVALYGRLGSFILLHIFIDFGQLCSLKPDTDVHGNRPAVFMISATRFQAGQHT